MTSQEIEMPIQENPIPAPMSPSKRGPGRPKDMVKAAERAAEKAKKAAERAEKATERAAKAELAAKNAADKAVDKPVKTKRSSAVNAGLQAEMELLRAKIDALQACFDQLLVTSNSH